MKLIWKVANPLQHQLPRLFFSERNLILHLLGEDCRYALPHGVDAVGGAKRAAVWPGVLEKKE